MTVSISMLADPADTANWNTQRWQLLQALFEQLSGMSADERRATLAHLATDDQSMAAALGELLSSHSLHDQRTDRDRRQLLEAAIQSLQTTLAPGDRLGAFRLCSELGRGGMGVVFLAERSIGRTAQQVAIKVLADHAVDAATRRRFLQEREILATLEHPNIARFLDAGETADGTPYVVMERVVGIPLLRYCDSLRLDIAARLRLFMALCGAVSHAHARLVLHRDIKPGNILVNSQGEAKLIDFGIATLLQPSPNATGTRERYFTPLNAAPEQLRGERATIGCDIYQLGTVLYEMLCGQPIFDPAGLTPAALETCILERPPDPPSVSATRASPLAVRSRGSASAQALAAALRGDLDNIVLQTLRKSASERYESVERLADDIQNYLADRPVSARRGHRMYRARKFVSRHRLAAVALVAFSTVLSALVVMLALQTQRLAHERDLARMDRDRADAAAGFLVDVFRTGDPNNSISRDMRISDVLDAAGRRLGGAGDVAAPLRVQLLAALADVRLGRAEFEAAQHLLNQAGALLAADDSAGHDFAARLRLVELEARVQGSLGNLRQAHALAIEAEALHLRLGNPPSMIWPARQFRARALLELASLSEARQAYDALYAAMLDDSGVDPLRLARVEHQMATEILMRQLDYAAAGRLLASAEQRMTRLLPEGHPERLYLEGARAHYQDEALGDSRQALVALANVHRRMTMLFGESSPLPAGILLWMGKAHQRLGDLDAAASHFERARHQFDAIQGERTGMIDALTRIGLLAVERDDDELAFASFDRAATIAGTLFGAKSPLALDLRARTGSLLARRGRTDDARRYLEAALAGDSTATPNRLWLHVDMAGLDVAVHPDRALARLDRIAPTLSGHADRLPVLAARAQAIRGAIAAGMPREKIH